MMECYVCNATPGPGGMRYGVRPAVGVCHACGIGVCTEHARRGAPPELTLLCLDHATPRQAPGVAAVARAGRGTGA